MSSGSSSSGQATASELGELLAEIRERLIRIESALSWIYHQQVHAAVKEYYSTAELAQALGRAEYTVREWARTGRIRAEKRYDGHGRHKSWVISHAELVRVRHEGLLPEAFGEN
jgi:hypothetical protein